MTKNLLKSLSAGFILLLSSSVVAQNSFFKDESEKKLKDPSLKRVIVPQKYRTLKVDEVAIADFLQKIPNESNPFSKAIAPVIDIPMPDGSFSKFKIWETSVMAPGLAAKFPSIKTYAGQGIDDPTATIGVTYGQYGFSAMILSSVNGSVFIDPYYLGKKAHYISYKKTDFTKSVKYKELTPRHRKDRNLSARPSTPQDVLAGQPIGATLRKYRLAVACTHEYAQAVTGSTSPSVAEVLEKIVVTVNRVNQVYERDIDVRLILVSDNNKIVFTTAASDPFTGNDDASILIDESQTQIDNRIGTSYYDIGHTFSTGAGGLAGVEVVCYDPGKAWGVTGSDQPYGDPYDIDYVAHEMGHQFGADHSFNSSTDACDGNGSTTTNAEPGSGSTIMAYAGICGTDDLQPNSDPFFHAVSYNQIVTYINSGDGNTCATTSATSNTYPTANAGSDYTIPKSTPFMLTGTGSDVNGDAITYCWEQIDVGATFSSWNSPVGTKAPLFRSFVPQTVPYRYFPKLSDVVNGTTTIGEIKPSGSRNMNFRLTVRDNRAGGGGVNFDETKITVNSNGPFIVTYPTATGVVWNSGETKQVAWNVVNTNTTPISCANVAIELSTDGGYTYPITLLASTTNSGTANITVPDISTTTARVRVRAIGNVFYNISSNDFTINSTTPVRWLNFSAVADKYTAKLTWSVNELDVAGYEIERSIDGISFTKIASVTSNGRSNYSTNDAKPFIGYNYYRIKQVDKNGNYSYSKIVRVSFNKIGVTWTVYPNPVKDNLYIVANKDQSNTVVQLTDMSGKLVYNKKLASMQTGQRFDIPVTVLARGVYTLKVYSGDDIKQEKIVLE